MGARNVLRRWARALKTGERIDLLSTDNLQLRPFADDTGKMSIGDGTYDMDLEVFLGSTTEKVTFDVGNSKLTIAVPLELASAGFTKKSAVTLATDTETLTSASYDTVTLIANASATTVTFPDAAAANAGARITIVSKTDAAHVLKPTTADKLIVPGDIAADSITMNSASDAGLAFEFMSDGANWALVGRSGTPLATDYTIQS